LVGCLIGGIGFTITCPAFFIALSVASPPSRVAFGIALASVVGGIGQFAAPFVFDAISRMFGQGPGRFPLLVSSIALVVGGVLLLLQHYTQQPKAANIKG
jgi:MFS family permease